MIRGGQGRTAREVAACGTALVVLACLAFLAGGVLALAEWVWT